MVAPRMAAPVPRITPSRKPLCLLDPAWTLLFVVTIPKMASIANPPAMK
ncbi:MAG: hypothetical protein HQK67_08875 [Desulfamplus sp.]|nr:hypothetical protein [Desulfamplus sp.]